METPIIQVPEPARKESILLSLVAARKLSSVMAKDARKKFSMIPIERFITSSTNTVCLLTLLILYRSMLFNFSFIIRILL
jgi:hypothetical protein